MTETIQPQPEDVKELVMDVADSTKRDIIAEFDKLKTDFENLKNSHAELIAHLRNMFPHVPG